MKNMTKVQSEVLAFCCKFYENEDRLPTTREIQHFFQWKSQTAAVIHLRALAKKGQLEYRRSSKNTRGRYRFPRFEKINGHEVKKE